MMPLTALAIVLLLMLAELAVSMRNERTLKALGAVEADDPVYGVMRWAYPGVFVAMALEGMRGEVPLPMVWAGAALFAVSKALKVWAIASLGHRWTYRVLVLPEAPLVSGGPYRFMRHPNYLAVLGELIAMALATDARIASPAGLLLFGTLLLLRIRAEERALHLY